MGIRPMRRPVLGPPRCFEFVVFAFAFLLLLSSFHELHAQFICAGTLMPGTANAFFLAVCKVISRDTSWKLRWDWKYAMIHCDLCGKTHNCSSALRSLQFVFIWLVLRALQFDIVIQICWWFLFIILFAAHGSVTLTCGFVIGTRSKPRCRLNKSLPLNFCYR